MLAFYSDGAYDRFWRVGVYCVVTIDESGKKDWFTEYEIHIKSAMAIELSGLLEAYRLAMESKQRAVIYCDSKHAIDALEQLIDQGMENSELITIHWIRAHTIDKNQMTDNIKYQHWADVQASAELRRRVDMK